MYDVDDDYEDDDDDGVNVALRWKKDGKETFYCSASKIFAYFLFRFLCVFKLTAGKASKHFVKSLFCPILKLLLFGYSFR